MSRASVARSGKRSKGCLVGGRVAGVAAACLGLALLAGSCGGHTGTRPTATAKATAPTGNGVASKQPQQILAAAEGAVGSATSVRMRGTVYQKGTRYNLDITLTRDAAKGSMTGPLGRVKNASFDYVVIGGKMYLRSSTLWRRAGVAAAGLLDNRWVILPSSSLRRSGGFPFRSTRVFARYLASSSTKGRSAGAATMLNGRPVIPVKTSISIVYVAATGPPFPLRVRPLPGHRQGGAVDFLDYGAPVNIAIPPHPIDLSNLHG